MAKLRSIILIYHKIPNFLQLMLPLAVIQEMEIWIGTSIKETCIILWQNFSNLSIHEDHAAPKQLIIGDHLDLPIVSMIIPSSIPSLANFN